MYFYQVLKVVVMNKTIAFYTLGCKLNYAETDAIANRMQQSGYTKVSFSSSADYYVINTCSVTESANKKSRYVIRKALRQNPSACVIIIGCYAQLKPAELIELTGAKIVLGAKDKFNIHEKIQELEQKHVSQIISSCDVSQVHNFENSYSRDTRTRSFLKVQDGCDYFCTYCTIPLARGMSRNAPIETIVKQAHDISSHGVKELVLTGINIGDFGKTTGENFYDLLQKLDTVSRIERIRISSIEPNLLNSEIIDFVAQSQICMPHFHIPLQAGSNDVLKLMKRRYSRELFEDKIRKIKQRIPHACIGVDVIVGTPGETPEAFHDSCDFIAKLPISYLHVFTYSERENTAALGIEPKVPIEERNSRSVYLHQISDSLQAVFFESNSNTIRPVLFETKTKNGFYVGYTDNYIKVQCKSHIDIRNTIHNVLLSYVPNQEYMIGNLQK